MKQDPERLWALYRQRGGTSRRHFLHLLGAGGGAAVLAACGDPSSPEAGGDAGSAATFFKDPEPFIVHGGLNLEARLERLGGFLTPIDHFFVRNNSGSLAVDASAYRLEVRGDAVTTPLSLTHDDLLNMPSRTLFSYVECGGNQRSFFGSMLGQTATGTQWGRGGVGMAEWTGVPLRAVLQQAGVRDDAVDVQLIGLDVDSPEGGFRRPLPIDKAMDPDTLLALRMNGSVLPPDHGFPVRALVPGWVGSNSIKWLGAIEVTTEKVWSRNNTTSYVLVGEDYPPEGEAEGQVANLQSIKSVLILPWPAALPAGTTRLRGYAYSPHAPIAGVEWSDDEGATWQPAGVLDPRMRYAWARFEFEWTPAGAGAYTIRTRATDEEGNAQPDTLPYNEKGYLFNLPLPHPVTVA